MGFYPVGEVEGLLPLGPTGIVVPWGAEKGMSWEPLPEGYCMPFCCHKYGNPKRWELHPCMKHASGLSCLLYHLHKSVTIKWGTDPSGCVCASSESLGDPINVTNSHLLSLLPLLWLIILSASSRDSALLSFQQLHGESSLLSESSPGKSRRCPYKQTCTAVQSIEWRALSHCAMCCSGAWCQDMGNSHSHSQKHLELYIGKI